MVLEDDAGGILSRDAQIGLFAYWRDIKVFYDSNDNLQYFCTHAKHKAETSDGNWFIDKYTYTGSNLTRIESLTGSVDNRATLNWG